MPYPSQFWKRVDKSEGCWAWTGPLTPDGYGKSYGFGEALAHRVSWRIHRGSVPEGLTIDHLCRNRACVNPDHMEIVTRAENTLRGIAPSAQNARKTHCSHGHPFDEGNTYRRIASNGCLTRACRTCRRGISQRHRDRAKAAA